ncbi:MAG: hypothetical protein MR517_10255, partial [Bacteroidales bacterium]|nr:hypothetical protein [Bacteroidales bacterium]
CLWQKPRNFPSKKSDVFRFPHAISRGNPRKSPVSALKSPFFTPSFFSSPSPSPGFRRPSQQPKTSNFFDKTLAAFFRKRTDFLCVSPDVLGESKGWSSDLITVDEYMSSLSAIIMDEDNYRWYEFVKGCSIN